jgi:hypothetical protein
MTLHCVFKLLDLTWKNVQMAAAANVSVVFKCDEGHGLVEHQADNKKAQPRVCDLCGEDVDSQRHTSHVKRANTMSAPTASFA